MPKKELTWEEWLMTPEGQERVNQFMELEVKSHRNKVIKDERKMSKM